MIFSQTKIARSRNMPKDLRDFFFRENPKLKISKLQHVSKNVIFWQIILIAYIQQGCHQDTDIYPLTLWLKNDSKSAVFTTRNVNFHRHKKVAKLIASVVGILGWSQQQIGYRSSGLKQNRSSLLTIWNVMHRYEFRQFSGGSTGWVKVSFHLICGNMAERRIIP